MLEVLLILATLVIGAQAIMIAILVDTIRNKTKVNKRDFRRFTRKIVRIVSDKDKELETLKEELEMYKAGYNECYSEYKAVYRERNIYKEEMEYYKELHSNVTNNISLMISQGRIIKDKTVYPRIMYRFDNMSEEDITTLYGAPQLKIVK